jgi:LuxR family quorum-sensing system transcriptional regulator CciR
MSRFSDVQAFAREAKRVSHTSELLSLLEGAVPSLGFDYFALIHHVEINATPAEAVVSLVHYPPAWADMVITRGYYSDDPVVAACQKAATGFSWSDVPKLIGMTPRQQEILNAAAAAGMGGGYTVPIHVPGEYAGSCSFGVRTGQRFPDESLPAIQYLGYFAFEAARRVARSTEEDPGPGLPPKLTQRQFDCIVLVARGKSDGDAGQLLGISPQTVHQHIEEAKRRYGVATRVQLVVRTLFDSQLTFGDIVK